MHAGKILLSDAEDVPSAPPLCGDSQVEKAYPQEITYFKSHMWLLTIATVYQQAERQKL